MIRRELTIFLVVGSLTVLVDFLTYRGLIWAQLLGVDVAKAIGFLTGTVFAYFANRYWTFGQKPHAAGSAWRFIVVYSLTLAVNVLVNSFLITWLPVNLSAFFDKLTVVNNFITTLALTTEVNTILSIITSKEAGIQLAFLIATITSATLNFIGMKHFVFKTTSLKESL